ncbi:thiol-disulfide oxidoreductase DCC family protein, partial [Salinivirga sp.]|uniref:thiol-disulfide oxidoreductase DCC family protein n=1 Tax=Salinivirga sp. TaxID=1970192 RepID=UPI0039C8DE2F
MKQNLPNKPVVFFDGNCGLCSRSINFIIKHDRYQHFLFCPLQSKTAEEFLG